MTGFTVHDPFADLRNRLIGWGAVCFVLAVAALPYLATGSVELYMVLYPVGAAVVALALYSVNRPLYVGFSLWMWFVTPFVRRLIDYNLGGYIENNFVMTAPYLVGGVGILGLWVLLTEEARGVRQAFWLVMAGLVYGGAIGLVMNGATAMLTEALDWGVPIVTGALLLVDWRQYPRYRTVILRTLTVGMGVMGLYGLYQYFVLPPWDKMWMEGAAVESIGVAEPLRVRVFGPLNSPVPYAITLVVGLLGMFAVSGQGVLWTLFARVAAVPAVVALSLSLTRAAWGGLVVGVLYILLRTRARSRRAIMAYLVLAAAASVPILLFQPIAMQVEDRIGSLGSLQDDTSLNDRVNQYQGAPAFIASKPIGLGLGAIGRGSRVTGTTVTMDSGVLAIFAGLGWAGAALYLMGFGLLVLWVWRAARDGLGGDRFVIVAAGTFVAVAATLPFANFFAEVGGVYLWGFLALSLAGARYHQAHLAAAPEPAQPGARPEAEPVPQHA